MLSLIRTTALLTLIATLSACQELPIDTALELDSGLEALDEEQLHDDELAEVPLEAEESSAAWTAHYYCTSSGSFDTGWASMSSSVMDFMRTRASWTASSIDGIGTITVSSTLNGITYSTLPSTLALTGAMKVNGATCGSVSVVDRDGNAEAKASASCTASWSGPSTTTVSVQDSSAGMRGEFIRSTGTSRYYQPASGSSASSCWWG